MYVCIYVCMYVCMYECMFVCKYILLSASHAEAPVFKQLNGQCLSTLLLTIVNFENPILILYWETYNAVHGVQYFPVVPWQPLFKANHILNRQRTIYHSNKMEATVSRYPLEIFV